jgi:hypothetical protein
MSEKKFFRVRIAEKSPLETKMVNGLVVTKQWQIKVGEIGDFAKFADVEAQVMVKQGNGFVPVGEPSCGATAGSGGDSGPSSGNNADGSKNPPDFGGMTVDQLKNFLIAHGVAQNDLRNATKPELIERAEYIWSQSK